MSNMTINTGTIEYQREAENKFFENLPPVSETQSPVVSSSPAVVAEVSVPDVTIPDDTKADLIAEARKVGAGYQLDATQPLDREALRITMAKLNGEPVED